MRFFVLIGLIIGTTVSHGQNRFIDSLKSQLPLAPTFKEEVKILHQLASEYWDYDFEKGLQYARQANQLSEDNQYAQGLVESLTDIGQYYYFTGDYLQAKKYFWQAIAASGNSNFGEYPAYTYIRIGNLFRVQSEFDSAQNYYDQAEKLLANSPARQSQSSLHHNQGLLYFERGNFKEALKQFKKALAIRQAMNDSLLIAESWKQMGNAYSSLSQVDSAEYYLNQVLRVANRHQDPELLIFYNLHYGDLLFSRGELARAAEAYLKANDLLATHDFVRYRAMVYKSIGALYEWQGDYQRAFDYLLKSLKINEQLGSKQEIAKIYASMGWAYMNQSNFQEAKSYADQSLHIMKQIKDEYGISSAYVLKGFISNKERDYTKAIHHYDSSILIREKLGTLFPLATAITFRADGYRKLNQLEKAERDLNLALTIIDQTENKMVRARVLNQLSEVLIARKAYDQALNATMQARNLARQIRSTPELRKSYLNQIEIYKHTRQMDEAIQAYDRYLTISDSLLNEESLIKQAQLSSLYQLEKKENEIEQLNRENANQQAFIDAQADRLRFQNYMIITLVTASVLLLALAYVLYFYLKSKKKANLDLKKLNEQIQEKNEEIQTQAEELVDANRILTQLNEELVAKQEEVRSQAEELTIANESINRINQELEMTVRNRTRQLQNAYNELDIFFYRSSHDFRRPLTTFLGLAEVASVTVKDQNALDLFAKVRETAKSLDRMLFKLQSISDIGSQQMVEREVRIKELLDEVIQLLQPEIEVKRIKLQVQVNVDQNPVSNPVLLRIAFENLIENAIHFARNEASEVFVHARQQGDRFLFSVQDNGEGIHYEFQDRIFEMYFRASEKSRGNGLGLYIVKKASERLRGMISFKSEPYQGSVFTLEIPMA